MFGQPDLLADGEVLWIAMQRGPPLGDRRLALSTPQEFGAESQVRLHQFPLNDAQLIGRLTAGCLDLQCSTVDELLDRLDIIGMIDAETAKLSITDDPCAIQEDTIRNNRIPIQMRQAILMIDSRWEGCTSDFDPGSRRFSPLGIDSDGDELKLLAVMALRLIETLPPGQLIPAASPAGPKEQQRLFAT